MADLIELYEKARLLNLQNLAHGKIDLSQETVSNVDYLDYVLSQELELRRQAVIKRHTNASRLPKREFDPARLKPGIAWQVEQLENMQWIDEGQNLVIVGKCDTGKTTLAAHIGQMALTRKEAVYYCNIDGNVKKCAVGKHPKSEKLGGAGQAACCTCTHSRYFTGGSPSGLRV